MSEFSTETPNKIINYFQAKDSGNELSKQLIVKWMQTNDLEVLGVLYSFLIEKKHYDRIKPNLSFKDYYEFIKHYFSLCFQEDRDSTWINSRFEAGWDLVNWFAICWQDPYISNKYINDLKDWLGVQYKNGNDEIRNCIITATLEHLFENKKMVILFQNWKRDPELRIAYDIALQFSSNGGKSPIGL